MMIPLVFFLLLAVILQVSSKDCSYNGIVVKDGYKIPDICTEIYCRSGTWTQTEKLSADCSDCEIYNDPHFKDYEGCYFDYMVEGSYSLSQPGFDYNPEYGVFAQFAKCLPPWAHATCLQYTTIKDMGIVINIGQRGGISPPEIYDIEINGCHFTVPSEHPKPITCNGKTYPVMAWRYVDAKSRLAGPHCYKFSSIRILTSHFLVQNSNNTLHIWVHNDSPHMEGMCGNVDNRIYKGSLIDRNTVPYDCPNGSPAPESWGESWKKQGGSSGRKRREVETEVSCEVENNTHKCHVHLNQISTNEDCHFIRRQGACAIDLCCVDESHHDSWLYQVGGMFAERDHIMNNTVDIHSGNQPIPREPIPSPIQIGTGSCGISNPIPYRTAQYAEEKIVPGILSLCQPDENPCKEIIRVLAWRYNQNKAEFAEYPWMAIILDLDDLYLGGGVLISSEWVLTVAHKVFYQQHIKVRLGEHDLRQSVDHQQYHHLEVNIDQIIIHPGFDSRTLANDVALLHLSGPVNTQNYPHIGTACLPEQGQIFSGQQCWVTGWGKDAFEQAGTFQNIMKEVDVPIVAPSVCEARLRNTSLGASFILDNTSFLCAGGVVEGNDACTIEGGAPVVCRTGGGWTVVGLVAWGNDCTRNELPGVYINVSKYVFFILETISYSEKSQ